MATAPRPTTAVRDVMTPDPRTCSTFSMVLEAVLLFRDADCSAVPVLEDGKPIGVLTDRDVALALADHEDLARLPVSQILSRTFASVRPDDPLGTAVVKLGNERERRLLVVDDNERLVGILAWSDVAAFLGNAAIVPAATA